MLNVIYKILYFQTNKNKNSYKGTIKKILYFKVYMVSTYFVTINICTRKNFLIVYINVCTNFVL